MQAVKQKIETPAPGVAELKIVADDQQYTFCDTLHFSEIQ